MYKKEGVNTFFGANSYIIPKKIEYITSTTCFNNLRGNQLPAALKESHVSVNTCIVRHLKY